MNMILIWTIVAVVFLIIEGLTAALVSVWFVVGSLAALAATAVGLPFLWQLVIFLVVSILFFLLLYSRLKAKLEQRRQPTNADMLIGSDCTVLETVDNLAESGSVFIQGKTWSARSADNRVIDAGAGAVVIEIQGVKLIIEPKEIS